MSSFKRFFDEIFGGKRIQVLSIRTDSLDTTLNQMMGDVISQISQMDDPIRRQRERQVRNEAEALLLEGRRRLGSQLAMDQITNSEFDQKWSDLLEKMRRIYGDDLIRSCCIINGFEAKILEDGKYYRRF